MVRYEPNRVLILTYHNHITTPVRSERLPNNCGRHIFDCYCNIYSIAKYVFNTFIYMY